jgi:hypothetical protein
MREMPRSLTGTNTGSFATHAHRIAPNQDNLELSLIRERGLHVGIMGWLLAWLIVNALFVVWWALVISSEMETRDRSVRGEGAGQPGFSTNLRRRLRL